MNIQRPSGHSEIKSEILRSYIQCSVIYDAYNSIDRDFNHVCLSFSLTLMWIANIPTGTRVPNKLVSTTVKVQGLNFFVIHSFQRNLWSKSVLVDQYGHFHGIW